MSEDRGRCRGEWTRPRRFPIRAAPHRSAPDTRPLVLQSASLLAALSAADALQVERWQGEAAAMLRRLDVVLLTLQGVAQERDPAKRLEVRPARGPAPGGRCHANGCSSAQILKNQVGGVAPDAAALMSRGDSLVYSAHAHSPLLADHLLTHYQVCAVLPRRPARDVGRGLVEARLVRVLQDKLRNRWALVMSEAECRRAGAAQAEEQLAALQDLLRQLDEWTQAFPDTIAPDQVGADPEPRAGASPSEVPASG